MLTSLRLQNFKCFSDTELPLRPLTLLSGLNGMGKSSVIQSLLALRQSHQQGLLPRAGLALNGDLIRLGTAQDALNEGASEEQIGLGLKWAAGRSASWRFACNKNADLLELLTPASDVAVFQEALFTDSFQYLQAERLGPRTSFETSDFIVRQHRQLGKSGEYTPHFLAVFGKERLRLPGLLHPAAASKGLQDQVEAWLREVSPGTRLHLAQHGATSGMDLVSLRFSFVRGKQASNIYRATNVGFGITYTLPLFVAVLAAKPGTLLLLENPEAHLHPRGQARMGEFLALAASAGVQLLVETHSDHVLNGIRVAVHSGKAKPEDVQVHFIQRSDERPELGAQVISPRMDRRGRMDVWPEGFFDEWDKSLELLMDGDA